MTTTPDRTLQADVGTPGRRVPDRRARFDLGVDDLRSAAESLLANGFRLALICAQDDTVALRVVYLFTRAVSDRRVELQVTLDPAHPHIPSLARISFAAGRFEREMRDLFGIVPDDHPMPSRMVRHFHWPRGWYPMLAAAGDPPPFGAVDGPFSFRAVEGPGVYEIPVGPVHAGMIGPGHFRFSVVGETVLNLKARLWFVHRGIEKLFVGRSPAGGLELAERISGDTSVGHVLAYCRAVEEALDLAVPVAAQRRRAMLLEMERLYNHVNDLGALCNDVGHSILNNQAQRVREQLLRINDDVTGSRLLRGAITVGGAEVRSLPDPRTLALIAADAAEIADLALGHSVVLDRFTGTAVLTRRQATDLGTLGYVARASGVDVDARWDHPVAGVSYPARLPALTDGDVLARFTIRTREIAQSVQIIAELLAALDEADERSAPQPEPQQARTDSPGGANVSGVGIVEGWRGTIVHRVELDAAGLLSRVKVVDPSFFNWPALPVAMADTIVPDFPLANKSFNLSYAGNDL